jgi:hypothetical protein
MPISNPLIKFQKMYQKKLSAKNVKEIRTFSTFTHVRQTCFANNFFDALKKKDFSTDLNQHEILHF